MATDEETIFFNKGPHKVGAVKLVYGNDGWDVIADHSISYEVHEILEPAFDLATKYERVFALPRGPEGKPSGPFSIPA